MYVKTYLHVHMYINTCSIREGHITCDAVAVNSKQSSVLNDLNYTVVDVIYHSVYTPPSFNICILKHKYIHVYTLSVLNCLSSYCTGVNYIHTCAILSMYYNSMCLCSHTFILPTEALVA